MTNQTQYFNNTTTTPAYINEVKRIQPQRGQAYLAVKATLLDGSTDNPNYEPIDLIVKGDQVAKVLLSFEGSWPTGYQEDAAKRVKVFTSVRIASISASAYLKKDGTAGAVLKGKLMEIKYCKVDDKVVFHPENKPVSVTGKVLLPAERAKTTVQQPAQQEQVVNQQAQMSA